MAEFALVNLKVVVYDSDYYAMQAINSYLAWDRRTRVTFMTTDRDDFLEYLRNTHHAEHPDVIVLDADHLGKPAEVTHFLEQLQWLVPDVDLICLAQELRLEVAEAVIEGGARAYLLKQDVGIQIAWAIIYAREQDFLITHGARSLKSNTSNPRLYNAAVLPEQREYPEMTDRVRQAIRLCVIEGMPAHLAADEMGISLHTIRGYIKEGYRILESYDTQDYPTDMTPQERAFMRFTALDTEDESA